MSLFHPLPASMPVFERARLMVKRGECADFAAAMSKLRGAGRSRVDKTTLGTPSIPSTPTTPTGVKSTEPGRCRLPYKDD